MNGNDQDSKNTLQPMSFTEFFEKLGITKIDSIILVDDVRDLTPEDMKELHAKYVSSDGNKEKE